jgi:hypothetical protein
MRAGSLSSYPRKAVIARASGQETLAGKNFADCVYGATIDNGAQAALWLVERLTAWAPSTTEERGGQVLENGAITVARLGQVLYGPAKL